MAVPGLSNLEHINTSFTSSYQPQFPIEDASCFSELLGNTYLKAKVRKCLNNVFELGNSFKLSQGHKTTLSSTMSQKHFFFICLFNIHSELFAEQINKEIQVAASAPASKARNVYTEIEGHGLFQKGQRDYEDNTVFAFRQYNNLSTNPVWTAAVMFVRWALMQHWCVCLYWVPLCLWIWKQQLNRLRTLKYSWSIFQSIYINRACGVCLRTRKACQWLSSVQTGVCQLSEQREGLAVKLSSGSKWSV